MNNKTQSLEDLARCQYKKVGFTKGDSPLRTYLAGAKFGADFQKNQEEWISVKDRLPDEKGHYVVWVDDTVTRPSRGNVYVEEPYDSVSDDLKHILKFKVYVTHWKEKPIPPKK